MKNLNSLNLLSVTHSLSLSLGHFSRWICVSRYQNVSILDLLELRVMEVVVTTADIICAKLQSNSHHQQTNTQFFGRPDAHSDAQQTVSKH